MIRQFLLAFMLLVAATFPARAGGRVGLVVGISDYKALPALPNAIGDARAVADGLKRAGFTVTLLVDPTIAALRAAVASAQSTASGASTALFYYAGHAVQFQNRDYLLAADADPRDADALDDQGLELTDVTIRMVNASLRLLFIDACRDTPVMFTRGSQGGRGLAPIAAGVGTSVVFSAAPGHAASDGTGGHSPFAMVLLRHMLTPGLELSPMLRAMASDLLDATERHQQLEPWDNRTASFFFVPDQAAATLPPATLTPGHGSVATLLAELSALQGTKRLYRLEDALHATPLGPGLDAGQTLAILGDIPAPALRRHALTLLIPSLLTPISEPEASHLLDGFDGMARGATLDMLLPCLALPMTDAEVDRMLVNISAPLRNRLAQAMHRPADRASCPAPKI